VINSSVSKKRREGDLGSSGQKNTKHDSDFKQ